MKTPLPIDPFLDEIVKDSQNYSTVLVKSSPGSGKTTRLPYALAQKLTGKVLVLEPRRLAAKLAAERIASEEGLKTGEEVGYHFRFDKKLTDKTKLIFYTEGTFLKKILRDPDLHGVDAVILDEFHERHIETDVALAFLRGLQKKRPELKLILMSATLDEKILSEFPDSKIHDINIPRFDVKIHHLPNQPSVLNATLETKVRNVLSQIDSHHDVLVFVPGMREMLQLKNYLGTSFGEVLLLHSELSKEEQELAMGPNSQRKIILSTNIAESSVTIPGIKVVIDSGIQRSSTYSPWLGLKIVEDQPVTMSSAIQRTGRAGRTSAGECYRLYAEQDFNNRLPFTKPEILEADLTETVLLVADFPGELKWLTNPSPERWKIALTLARQLGALDEQGKLTPIGRKMEAYPLGARVARILVAGEDYKLEQKKKLLTFICEELEKDRYGVLKNKLSSYLKTGGASEDTWEKAVLSGFVDQVSLFREKKHDFIHYSGKTLKPHLSLKDLHHDYFLILDITQRQEAINVFPILEEWLYDLHPFPFSEEDQVNVDSKIQLVRKTKLGSIVMEESTSVRPFSKLSAEAKKLVLTQGENTFQKNKNKFQESEIYMRLHFWARHHKWDLSILENIRFESFLLENDHLNWDDVSDFLKRQLEKDWSLDRMDENLPLKINLGGKRELEVHYTSGEDPYVEAPMQDFYGVKTTPTILKGQFPLTLKLIGPHRRPIQVTRDLPGFWKKMYVEMKREWQRDYPRHHWPDDPQNARPVLLKRMLDT